jgi:hypothetical protein
MWTAIIDFLSWIEFIIIMLKHIDYAWTPVKFEWLSYICENLWTANSLDVSISQSESRFLNVSFLHWRQLTIFYLTARDIFVSALNIWSKRWQWSHWNEWTLVQCVSNCQFCCVASLGTFEDYFFEDCKRTERCLWYSGVDGGSDRHPLCSRRHLSRRQSLTKSPSVSEAGDMLIWTHVWSFVPLWLTVVV